MFDTYYLRSMVLGGRVVAEVLGSGQKSRGYVYTAEGGMLAFHRLPVPGDVSDFVGIEHDDAAGLSVRVGGAGGSSQWQYDGELDAVGVNMATAEQYVAPEPEPPAQPDEADPSPFPAYGNPGNRVGQRCSWDGLPRDCDKFWRDVSFIAGGVRMLRVEDSPVFVGRGTLTTAYWDKRERRRDETVALGTYEMGAAVRFAGFFRVSVTQAVNAPKAPTLKNASPGQQSRFDAAFGEVWKRLHENQGDNPCAKLLGGIKKAERALKETKFSVGRTSVADAYAETLGKNVTIDPNNGFFDTNGSFSIPVGIEYVEGRVGINQSPVRPVSIKLENVQAAAFFLLHELGHRTGELDPDNSPSGFDSVRNSGKIHKACFGAVASR